MNNNAANLKTKIKDHVLNLAADCSTFLTMYDALEKGNKGTRDENQRLKEELLAKEQAIATLEAKIISLEKQHSEALSDKDRRIHELERRLQAPEKHERPAKRSRLSLVLDSDEEVDIDQPQAPPSTPVHSPSHRIKRSRVVYSDAEDEDDRHHVPSTPDKLPKRRRFQRVVSSEDEYEQPIPWSDTPERLSTRRECSRVATGDDETEDEPEDDTMDVDADEGDQQSEASTTVLRDEDDAVTTEDEMAETADDETDEISDSDVEKASTFSPPPPQAPSSSRKSARLAALAPICYKENYPYQDVEDDAYGHEPPSQTQMEDAASSSGEDSRQDSEDDEEDGPPDTSVQDDDNDSPKPLCRLPPCNNCRTEGLDCWTRSGLKACSSCNDLHIGCVRPCTVATLISDEAGDYETMLCSSA